LEQGIRKGFGTRHRVALGMSKESNAVILVVSEESKVMSLAFDSKI
jgi:diadenylate cyclase